MHVIKKTKGKKSYYYLKHSYRTNKVNTKEIYLGNKMPKDIEKQKQELKKECNKELYEKLNKIKEHHNKEWKKFPQSIKNKYLKQISIEFTYNTNAIEGSTLTYEDTRQLLEEGIAPKKQFRDIQETKSHALLFEKILNNNSSITKNILLEWHKELFQETKPDIAGELRDYSVRVGNYRAPDWQDIKQLLEDLFKNQDTEQHPVELAARMHYRFEKIHPFGDGNGRVGRLLMNAILWNNNYPPLIIQYKNRKSYYNAFQSEEKFINYFIRRYLAENKK